MIDMAVRRTIAVIPMYTKWRSGKSEPDLKCATINDKFEIKSESPAFHQFIFAENAQARIMRPPDEPSLYGKRPGIEW